MRVRRTTLFLLELCLFTAVLTIRLRAQILPFFTVHHVLLISVDGLHALDLANFIRSHPDSALAQLSAAGVTYTRASTSRPSDSFPGLLSMVTGGSPISTGVWYEGSYARSLSPPGSNCKTVGSEVIWDGSIDKTPKTLDAGGGIDPAKLPLDPSKGCVPVYPHSYLRVNTIFELVHSAGMRTAWIDKHPSYEMVNGPSGLGVDDLFTPDVAAIAKNKDVKAWEAYDDLKVQAILNEIGGKDHTGKKSVGVPELFGITLQALVDAQGIPTGGYTNASGTPSAAVLDAIGHADQSIGKIVSALKARDLFDSTLVIVTAKHGESPMDRSKRRIIDAALLPNLINRVAPGLAALVYEDGDLASIWLTDQSQTGKVAEIFSQSANQSAAGIQRILWGESLKLMFNDPLQDRRTPDIVVVPNPGTIYAPVGSKLIAGHGGFNKDDTNVALLVANPRLRTRLIKTPVETTQIAPTILTALGIDPQGLQAVRMEKTCTLPGLFLETRFWLRALTSR